MTLSLFTVFNYIKMFITAG